MQWNNVFDLSPQTELETKFIALLNNEDIDSIKNIFLNNETLFISFLEMAPLRFELIISKLLNNETIKTFLKVEKNNIQNITYSFYKNQTNKLTGILNIEDNTITLDDNKIKSILNNSNPVINEDVVDLVDTCVELNLKNIPVEIQLEDKVIISKKNTGNIINAGLISASLLMSLSCFADEANPELARDTIRAVKEVREVRDFIDGHKKDLEFKAKKFVDSIEHKEVAAVAAVITKVAIEQKISYKSKLNTSEIGLSELGLGKLDYGIEVRLNGDVKGGIGGNNPYMKGSDYEINAVTNKKETKIQIEMKFAFN